MDHHQEAVWMTVGEAAARAKVGNKVIYREVNSHRLRAARVGGRRELRTRPEWVDQWLESTAEPQEIGR
jgi:excisionase family DNA binding protein